MRKLVIDIETFLVVCFSASLALGTLNPFLMGGPDEESGLGLSQLFTVLMVPYLYWKYRGGVFNSLAFNKWQRSLILFFFAAFLTSFLQITLNPGIEFFVYWAKLFFDIALCIILPVSFSDKRIINISILVFAVACILLSIAVMSGVLSDYVMVNNGRMWLWGENPNSTSCRWSMAIIFIVYLVTSNPFEWGKVRLILLAGILPLFVLIFLSGSRGSLLISGLCLILYFPNISRKNIIRNIFIFSIMLISLYFLVASRFSSGDFAMIERLQESADEGGNIIRENLLKAAMNIFWDNPIFGVGSTNFMNLMTNVYHMENTVHNLYAYIMAVSGIVGFIPYAVFMVYLAIGCYRYYKNNVIASIMLVYIVLLAYKTGGMLCYLFMWYIYAVIISFINISKKESLYL